MLTMYQLHRLKKFLPITISTVVILIVVGFAGQGLAATSGVIEERIVTGINYENLFNYSPLQYDIVANILTLGYAAQAAGLVYFLATMNNVAPRYRTASVLSAVVMASAFLELFRLEQDWNYAFVYTDGVWQLSDTAISNGDTFSNGFRYMNWSIDVPMLLLQLVIVLGISRSRSVSYGVKFIASGLLMIWTGYVGQFFEATNLVQYAIWGAISTVFYIYILVVLWKMVTSSIDSLPKSVQGIVKNLRWYVLITWTLYVVAYLLPVLWPVSWSVVTRQIIYTIADISTKVIYGAILSYVAIKRSEDIGFEPAIKASQQ
jgi:bacteriorhodopsin